MNVGDKRFWHRNALFLTAFLRIEFVNAYYYCTKNRFGSQCGIAIAAEATAAVTTLRVDLFFVCLNKMLTVNTAQWNASVLLYELNVSNVCSNIQL